MTYLREGAGKGLVVYIAINVMSYYDEIETQNQKENFFALQIVPWGLSVAEVPLTALHNSAQLYSNQANTLVGIQ